MTCDPRISIIIPAYNVDVYLATTLESILAQDFGDWECLVIDDGSTDGTWDILERFAATDTRIRAFCQSNVGAAEARNFGMGQISSESKYVIFMDSDDVYVPEALRTLYDAAESDPHKVGAHALADYIDCAGRPLHPGFFAEFGRKRLGVRGARIRPVNTDEPTDLSVLLVKALHPPGTFIVRREVVERVGPMDKGTSPQEDWDYWIRVARHGDFAFRNRIVVKYRRHDSNASGQFAKSYRMARYVRYKAYRSPENTYQQQDLLRRYYVAWNLHRASEKWTLLKRGCRQGRLGDVPKLGAHLMLHACCALRGYPTKRC